MEEKNHLPRKERNNLRNKVSLNYERNRSKMYIKLLTFSFGKKVIKEYKRKIPRKLRKLENEQILEFLADIEENLELREYLFRYLDKYRKY